MVVELVEKHENWRPALDPLPDGQLVHHQLMSGGQIELISGMRRSSAPAALNASSQQLQDVEGSLVGPVEILDDDDGDAVGGQAADQRPNVLVRMAALGDEALNVTTDLFGDVDEQPKRAR